VDPTDASHARGVGSYGHENMMFPALINC
jgi:hypothetical protein